jgi:hypothetical protein
MKKIPFSKLALLLPLVVACGSSTPRNTFGDNANDPGGGGAIGGNDPNLPNGASPASTPPPATYVPPTDLGCPSRAQEILALDFRSGWWSGGGGGGYASTVLPVVVGACPQTSIDYHHFETSTHVKCVYDGSGGSCQTLDPAVTVLDIENTFVHPNANDYTQIWVLSGSDQDPSDIPVGDQLFQGILGTTTGACLPLLVAAGDGFMMHAKTIAQQLGMGDVFTEETNPPSFFSVAVMPAAASSNISGSSMATNVLFKGVPSVVDQVGSLTGAAKGDSIADSVPAPHIYNVIAHDSLGKSAIAVGAANTSSGYRPFIFDAGWQRTYVLGDAGTAQYLKNIVMYMGLVGCKAAPIGPIN